VLVGVASKHYCITGQVLLSKSLAIIPGLMEPKWEIFRANLASMNQIMPNSQETVLKITLTEALVLTRQHMQIHHFCPYYSR